VESCGRTKTRVRMLSWAQLQIDGGPKVVRADAVADCGASKNKPFCDGSQHEVGSAQQGSRPSG